MHLNMADAKGTFAPGELAEVEQFFSVKLKELEEVLEIENSPGAGDHRLPRDNFFVDDNGTPCGYFDLSPVKQPRRPWSSTACTFPLQLLRCRGLPQIPEGLYASYAQASGPTGAAGFCGDRFPRRLPPAGNGPVLLGLCGRAQGYVGSEDQRPALGLHGIWKAGLPDFRCHLERARRTAARTQSAIKDNTSSPMNGEEVFCYP